MGFNIVSLRKFKPAVRKVWLQFSAGLVWYAVGLMLIDIALGWLRPVVISTMFNLVILGLLLAASIYFFGFSKLAKKNITRICGINGEKVCLFAFQRWTSYPLVLFMMFLGIFLRTYSPISKPLLAILYLGIGGGLLTASLHYFVNISQELRNKHNG